MRRGGAVAAVTVGAWLALAGTVEAATISGGSSPGPPGGIPLPLRIDAAANEVNRIEVVGSGGGFIVREIGTTTLNNSAPSCTLTGTRQYSCSLVAPGAGGGDADHLRHARRQGRHVPRREPADPDHRRRRRRQRRAGQRRRRPGRAQRGRRRRHRRLLQPRAAGQRLARQRAERRRRRGRRHRERPEHRAHRRRRRERPARPARPCDNRLDGGGGADVLDGGDGADNLLGCAGNDQLTGGPAATPTTAARATTRSTRPTASARTSTAARAPTRATVDVADRLLGMRERPARRRDSATATATARSRRRTATTATRRSGPGAVDIPRNGVDEDCSGSDAKRRTRRLDARATCGRSTTTSPRPGGSRSSGCPRAASSG